MIQSIMFIIVNYIRELLNDFFLESKGLKGQKHYRRNKRGVQTPDTSWS